MMTNFLRLANDIGFQPGKILWDAVGSQSYWFRNTV